MFKRLNEELEKYVKHFVDDDIKLTKEELKAMQDNVHAGNLTGEVNGNKYEIEVSISGGKKLEDLTPNMKRFIFELVCSNVNYYSFTETVTIASGEQGGFEDAYGYYIEPYELTKEDLESISNNIKEDEGEFYTTVDVGTTLVWNGNKH